MQRITETEAIKEIEAALAKGPRRGPKPEGEATSPRDDSYQARYFLTSCPGCGAARRPPLTQPLPPDTARCTADPGPRLLLVWQRTWVPGLQRTTPPGSRYAR